MNNAGGQQILGGGGLAPGGGEQQQQIAIGGAILPQPQFQQHQPQALGQGGHLAPANQQHNQQQQQPPPIQQYTVAAGPIDPMTNWTSEGFLAQPWPDATQFAAVQGLVLQARRAPTSTQSYDRCDCLIRTGQAKIMVIFAYGQVAAANLERLIPGNTYTFERLTVKLERDPLNQALWAGQYNYTLRFSPNSFYYNPSIFQQQQYLPMMGAPQQPQWMPHQQQQQPAINYNQPPQPAINYNQPPPPPAIIYNQPLPNQGMGQPALAVDAPHPIEPIPPALAIDVPNPIPIPPAPQNAPLPVEHQQENGNVPPPPPEHVQPVRGNARRR